MCKQYILGALLRRDIGAGNFERSLAGWVTSNFPSSSLLGPSQTCKAVGKWGERRRRRRIGVQYGDCEADFPGKDGLCGGSALGNVVPGESRNTLEPFSLCAELWALTGSSSRPGWLMPCGLQWSFRHCLLGLWLRSEKQAWGLHQGLQLAWAGFSRPSPPTKQLHLFMTLLVSRHLLPSWKHYWNKITYKNQICSSEISWFLHTLSSIWLLRRWWT